MQQDNKRRGLGINTKFSLIISVMVVVVACSLVFLINRIYIAELKHEEFDDAISITTIVGERYQYLLNELERDAIFIRDTRSIQGILRASLNNGVDPDDGSTLAEWKQNLITILTRLLQTNPDYIKVRYIAVADGGRELLEVARQWGTDRVHVVADEQLQSLGDKEYFKEVLRRKSPDIYYSSVHLIDHLQGTKVEKLPVIHGVVPILQENGQVFGMMIIDKVMQSPFVFLDQILADHQSLFIANEEGELLYYPKQTLASVFGSAPVYYLEAVLPATAVALSTGEFSKTGVVQEQLGEISQVIGHYRVETESGNPEKFVDIVITDPYQSTLDTIARAQNTGIIITLALLGFFLGVSIWFSRSLARPILRLRNSMSELAMGNLEVKIPALNRADEIGEMANAVQVFKYNAMDRGRLEKERERSEDRFRTLVDAAAMCVLEIDEDNKITLLNAEAERVFGYKRDELIGQSIDVLVPERLREQYAIRRWQILSEGLEGEIRARRIVHVLCKNGREIQVEAQNSFIQTHTGPRLLSTSIDVTEKLKLEEERERSEKRFRSLIDSTAVGVLEVDSYDCITLINPELEDMFGYSEKELFGQEVDFLIPEWSTSMQEERDVNLSVNTTKRVMDENGRILLGKRKDDTTFPIQLVYSQVEFESTERTLVNVIDITAQYEQEEKLRKSLADSERVNRLMQDRESRIIELKQEVNILCQQQGSSLHYPVIASNDVLDSAYEHEQLVLSSEQQRSHVRKHKNY